MNRIQKPSILWILILLAGCAAHHSPPSAPEQPNTRIFKIGGSTIAIHDQTDHSNLTPDQIDHWTQTAAHAVTKYLGKFPVARVDVTIESSSRHGGGEDGGGDIDGRTDDGRYIHIWLPNSISIADFDDDWVMTHEMFHLAFPVMPRQQKWMNEGLSTYLEPIARARNGTLSQKECWGQFVVGLPQGLPRSGDQGLDFDHSRDRVYWGGCLYWLLADIQIRQQTHGRRSLVDSLRAILASGGDGSVTWPPEKVFDIGDHATGTNVLHALYEKFGQNPGSIDLANFWDQLGVEYTNQAITFHDDAPLANMRKAISGG